MTLTAIVTGSTKGIGKATASLLATNGMNVVVCSRSQTDTDRTVNEIKELKKQREKSQQKAEVIGFRCDVGQSDDVSSIVKSAISKFGRIDILINNAGILVYKNLTDTSEEEWANTININLTGTFLFCKAVLPSMMKNNSGTIINVSSGGGKMGFPKLSAYCASKFGAIGLTESLAGEVNNYNIRAMTICPGEIDTQMIKDAINSGFRSNCKRQDMYKPEDVAQKIWEMITNPKKYKNNQCVEFYSGSRY